MAPPERAIAVVGTQFEVLRGGQVQLANEAAVVSGLGEQLRHELLVRREKRISVAMGLVCRRIATGEERRARRRADRALRVSSPERDAFRAQVIELRRRDVRLSKRADGVVALLVRAVPEDVGARLGRRRSNGCHRSWILALRTDNAGAHRPRTCLGSARRRSGDVSGRVRGRSGVNQLTMSLFQQFRTRNASRSMSASRHRSSRSSAGATTSSSLVQSWMPFVPTIHPPPAMRCSTTSPTPSGSDSRRCARARDMGTRRSNVTAGPLL